MTVAGDPPCHLTARRQCVAACTYPPALSQPGHFWTFFSSFLLCIVVFFGVGCADPAGFVNRITAMPGLMNGHSELAALTEKLEGFRHSDAQRDELVNVSIIHTASRISLESADALPLATHSRLPEASIGLPAKVQRL